MTLLPIIERQLRIGARAPATYRHRCLVVALATLITGVVLILNDVGSQSAGFVLFIFLGVMLFCGALLEGVLRMHDAISRERREGTLGLLFLTDLRPRDVLWGKLAAGALPSLYGALALIPILALPLLVGGVALGEFLRVALLALNTLFFAFAVGLWGSARAVDAGKSIGLASLWVFPPLLAMPMLNLFSRDCLLRIPEVETIIACLPHQLYRAFNMTYNSNPAAFWLALGATHLTAWTALWRASAHLRHWNRFDETQKLVGPPVGKRQSLPDLNACQKPRLDDQHPIAWVVKRQPYAALRLWGLVAAIFFIKLLLHTSGYHLPHELGWLSLGLNFLFILLLASVAANFFSHAKQSGALELLIITPQTPQDIFRGQLRGWMDIMASPVLIWILIHIGMMVSLNNTVTGLQPFGLDDQILFLAMHALWMLSEVAALCMVALWFSISDQKPELTILKALIWVFVVPWFVFLILHHILHQILQQIGMFYSSTVLFWGIQAGGYAAWIVKDLFFILLARTKIYAHLSRRTR